MAATATRPALLQLMPRRGLLLVGVDCVCVATGIGLAQVSVGWWQTQDGSVTRMQNP